MRRKWRDEQVAQLAAARQRTQLSVKEAKSQIRAEANEAKTSLAANSQALADQITQAILNRRTV